MDRHAYGDGPDQYGELRPPATGGPWPVAVLVHGGFWRAPYTAALMVGLAEDLTARGWATWNLEYRRVGAGGGREGGWPATLADVAAGIDALHAVALYQPLDLDDVTVVGHSAGGHLALWSAARVGLPPGAPGAAPLVRPAQVLALAPVADLADAATRRLGADAAQELLGGAPEDVPERYEIASPAARLPLGVRTVIVHGTLDDRVPVEASRGYAVAARAAGDDVHLEELEGVDHFAVIDAASPAWARARALLR